MKSYPHLISKLWFSPLVITPSKHAAICQVLAARMDGGMPSDMEDEIEPPEMDSLDGTAIIPVHGILGKHLSMMEMVSGGCDLENVNRMICEAECDSSITRIIYDFRTPGGDVVGVPETGRKILNSSKETIGFFDSECASGGMWLASQCQKLYGTPSGRCGSIGVWCAYLDESRKMANEGEAMQTISAGKFKLMGAYWKPLTESEKAILQRDVDGIYDQFKAAVNSVRQVNDDAMGEGLMFDGEEAADRGLIDGCVEDLDELLDM